MTFDPYDPTTFAPTMTGGNKTIARFPLHQRTLLVLLVLLAGVMCGGAVFGQGTENFENMPPSNATYLSRTWVGTDGVTWTAEGARTDRTLNGRAICFGTSGNRWVTSPVYAGGMGTLTFNYVRDFTGTSARSLQVWVNGAQVGPTIVVSPTLDDVVAHSQVINVGGNVTLQIRSTGGGQVKLDDIAWTPFTPGPTVTFATPAGSHPEDAGSVQVNMNISPATVAAGTITIGVANGPGVTYGVAGDYTTTPGVVGGVITLNVPAGATTASFTVNIVDDLATEPDETITFTITGGTGGIAVGGANTHTFTIIDNDVTPTVNFTTLSIAVMENAGMQTFQLSIMPPAPAAGSITIQVVNGPGATYGMGGDYLTNPQVIGGNITVNFVAGATTAFFTVTVLDDLVMEDTEVVTFNIINVPAGYVIGSNTSATLTIYDNDHPPTVLDRGDLVIVGMNANDGACSGTSGSDVVSFFCFKPLHPGTTLDITDQGYSRCTPGTWGTNEGLMRITRTGPVIPAGTVITLRLSGSGSITPVVPDALWGQAVIGGHNFLNMNSNGDQLFFMQGGTWNNPPGNHNATYDGGTILYGFSSNGLWLEGQCEASNANQHSGLPPQMQCYSMEPTTVSDFAKYTGPVSATSQRGWIIRIGDPTNWSTYLSCAAYHAAWPNYGQNFNFAITTVGFTPGVWTGGVSTDWFDCRNWDDAQVPAITTDVTLNQTALNNCVVGLATGISPGGIAECAKLDVINNATSRHLTVAPNSTLNVAGPVTVERTGGTGNLILAIQGGATLNATSLMLESVNAGSGQARLDCNTATSIANLETHLTIGSGGRVDLGAGGTINLGGNWTNMASEAMFVENSGTVVFNGNGDQFVTTAGFEEVFFNLRLQKPGSDLLPGAPIAVRGQLDLQDGLVQTTATNLLSMRAGSTTVNASDMSFVHGPMRKIGLTPFTFPVGKGESLRPCGLRNYTGAAGDAFTAEYFNASPIATFGNVLDPMLHHISDCEYWIIDRSVGTPSAVVELTWDTPESCGVDDLPNLRVARFDGTTWLDRGNGGATGDSNSGKIPTATVQTQFSPWTLASMVPSNPLPIQLISFAARAEGDDVRLDWVTATEVNNDFFTIERSRDGIDFVELLEVAGAGTSYSSTYYTELDRTPLDGINYYRLRQTDLDGTYTYSPIAAVLFQGNYRELVVFGDRDVIQALHTFGPMSHFEVLDMTGRIIQQGNSGEDGRTQVPAGLMTRGAYIFRIREGDRVESIRFIY